MRREQFYSLEAPVLLPRTVGVLDHEEDLVLSGEEMVQPIVVHLPSNTLNVNGSVSQGYDFSWSITTAASNVTAGYIPRAGGVGERQHRQVPNLVVYKRFISCDVHHLHVELIENHRPPVAQYCRLPQVASAVEKRRK